MKGGKEKKKRKEIIVLWVLNLWFDLKFDPFVITNDTPFSLAHAYKAERGGSFLRCGIPKKRVQKAKRLPSNSKKVSTIITDGTLLLRFRVYKAESERRFFRCGTTKDAV